MASKIRNKSMRMIPKPIRQYAKSALNKYIEDITDDLFAYIQNDPKLLSTYNSLSSSPSSKYPPDFVNQAIGKYIKTRLRLKNIKHDNKPKTSTIITKYTTHKL